MKRYIFRFPNPDSWWTGVEILNATDNNQTCIMKLYSIETNNEYEEEIEVGPKSMDKFLGKSKLNEECLCIIDTNHLNIGFYVGKSGSDFFMYHSNYEEV